MERMHRKSDEAGRHKRFEIFEGDELLAKYDYRETDTEISDPGIFVQPKYRKRGIGSDIMRRLTDRGKAIRGVCISPEGVELMKAFGATVRDISDESMFLFSFEIPGQIQPQAKS